MLGVGILLIVLPVVTCASVNAWTFESGSDSAFQPGLTSVPGARRSASCWMDTTGKLVVFGGVGVDAQSDEDVMLADMWSYDTSTSSWSLVGGSVSGNVRASMSSPGSRRGASVWKLLDGNVYMLGGNGLSSDGVRGDLSDFWRFSQGVWTFLGTSEGLVSQIPVEQPMTSSWPGARRGASTFVDGNGVMYLFGGYGVGSTRGISGSLGDLWRYLSGTKKWEFVAGSKLVSSLGSYGRLGITTAGSFPPARSDAASWTIGSKLFIFGGFGSEGFFNDVWMFDQGYWTWIAGQQGVSQPGLDSVPSNRYGTLAVLTSDQSAVYLFGGYSRSAAGFLNELWMFDMATFTFKMISGSRGPNWSANGCKKGHPSPNVVPGARTRHCSWVVGSDFFVFGGFGVASKTSPLGYLNDLYSYKSYSSPPEDMCNGAVSEQVFLASEASPSTSAVSSSTVPVIIAVCVTLGGVLIIALVVFLIVRYLRQKRSVRPKAAISFSRRTTVPETASSPTVLESPRSPSSPTSPQQLITKSSVNTDGATSPRRVLEFDE